MKTLIQILLLTLFAFTAQARVFNATEEIRLQPTGGIFMESASLSASQPLKLGASKEMVTGNINLASEVTGILPLANGGTGSATQNFVDLTTNQTVGGTKNFTGKINAVSTTTGFNPCPVMTEAQRDAIVTLSDGDCIYNDDTNKLNVYSSPSWSEVAGGGLAKWATGTSYLVDDVIWDPTSEQIYRANSAHTAGATFAGDAANWDKLAYEDGLTANLLTFGAGDGTLEQDANLSYVSATQTFTVGFLDFLGTNAQISPNNANDDLILVGNGSGDVVLDGLSVNGTVLSTDAVPGTVTIEGKTTGNILLNDDVEFVSASSPSTPSAGNFVQFADTDPSTGLVYGPYFKDSNGVEKPVDAEIARNVIANGSFEESHAGDPDVGWTVSGSATNAIETTFRIASEGKQALVLTPSAEGFEYSQTFSCTRYPAVPVGFTAYVRSNTPNVQVCGFNGTTDLNCVDVENNATYKQYLAENTGGGTCGIKIKSTANVTGQIYIDGVNFTDQPYRFVDVQNTTEWVDYTPTSSGFGGIAGTDFKYRRVGDSIEIHGRFDPVAVAASEAQIGLPSGLTIDSSKVSVAKVVGHSYLSGANSVEVTVIATGGDAYLNFGRDDSGNSAVPQNGNAVANNGLSTLFFATVPIAEWSATNRNVVSPLSSGGVTERLLTADRTDANANSDVGDFTITGLVVGQTYHVSGKFKIADNGGGINFDFRSGAAGGGTLYDELNSGNETTGAGSFSRYPNFKFVAVSDTLYVYQKTTSVNTDLLGSSSKSESYLQVQAISDNSLLAFPFDVTTTKKLTSDQNNISGDIGDLTFTNLVVGDCYRIGGQVTSSVNTSTLDAAFRSASGGGGTQYGRSYHSVAASSAHNHSPNIVFKAASSSLYFNIVTTGGSTTLLGDDSLNETFIQLTHLKTTQCD